jgi:hypothetical protein
VSEVVCFRLDGDNPREARALAVLRAWQEAGYSRRHVLTEALLRLDGDAGQDTLGTVAELREVLGRAHDLLAAMQDGRRALPLPPDEPQGAPLSASFIASVRKTARPGMSGG